MSTDTIKQQGFTAPKILSDSLQRVLVDLLALSLDGKQAHWNLVGPNFRDLHLNLDEVVDIARRGSDTVAERMRAVHATPDGRPQVVAEQTSLPVFPEGQISTHDAVRLAVSAIEATVATIREVRDDVDEADPASTDVLHSLILELEQQAWFLGSELSIPEN